MQETRGTTPEPDQLWLSRPPFVLLAQVRSVAPQRRGQPAMIDYALLDTDGSPLLEICEPLDSSWWATFKRLIPRYG